MPTPSDRKSPMEDGNTKDGPNKYGEGIASLDHIRSSKPSVATRSNSHTLNALNANAKSLG